MTHAMLSPSGSERWMTCSGSVAMEQNEPEDTNEYADEGTAAHGLAATCLKQGEHPAAYLGRVLEVVNGVCLLGYEGPRPAKLKGQADDIVREFEVDTDFASAVNAYVQSIREYTCSGSQWEHLLYIEQALPVDHITGEEGATGTGDAVIITADGEELQSHDLKFGMGVKVYAKENPQALHYLSGARRRFPGDYKRFLIVIHQPRLGHLDEWACTPEELDAFEAHARQRAALAMMALRGKADWWPSPKDVSPPPVLVVSDKGCTFCRAKATCPALAKHVEQTVGAAFDVLVEGSSGLADNVKTAYDTVAARVPTDLPTLGLKLRAVDLVEDWCKAVRAKVEGALFERNNDAEAQAALGHKLVQGRKGNRAWADETATEAALKKMRLKQDEMYSFKLLTPSKAEAFFKATPKRWPAVEALIAPQKPGKPSVATLDDKRPALVLTPVADAFDDASGKDLV